MAANHANHHHRRPRTDDDAVSPVIATILMVAITVVLGATVYIWVSGFGTSQPQAVSASFTARSVDLPSSFADADSDSSDDSLEIVFAQAAGDFALTEVSISIDGAIFTTNANGTAYAATGWVLEQTAMSDGVWHRGDSILVHKAPGVAVRGTHLVRVTVQGQVILDTAVEVHDNL